MTDKQLFALAAWASTIGQYLRPGEDVIVHIRGGEGGSAEVLITSDGEVFSTTTGQKIETPDLDDES